ncbi:MAG: DUF420 domain-containing protein [Pirellulaceae bacterium]|nr:DUF420 domain-containing protein [Pirellulaceae bacterium]
MALTEILPHVNAGLNLLATVLLVLGYMMIKQKQEQVHKRIMLSCFAVSCIFLVSYLTNYALQGGNTPFPKDKYPTAAMFYYPFLIAHVTLAAVVPVLALVTIVLGLKDRRVRHRRWARWTFPIWLYVSISGVIVYLMIRWIFLP